MKNPMKNVWFLIGFIGLFTIGSNFTIQMFRAFGQNQNIYWTNNSIKLPFSATKNEIELFINGKSLQKHLADGTLFALEADGKYYRIVPKDITARINNWHKVKSTILVYSVMTMAALGFFLAFMGIWFSSSNSSMSVWSFFNAGLLKSLLLLFFSHGVSYYINYINKKEYLFSL